jgi:hypothetical protein
MARQLRGWLQRDDREAARSSPSHLARLERRRRAPAPLWADVIDRALRNRLKAIEQQLREAG